MISIIIITMFALAAVVIAALALYLKAINKRGRWL